MESLRRASDDRLLAFQLTARYVRDEGFWLPERNVSVSHVRIGGEARLTIEYGEYHVVARHAEGQAETGLLAGQSGR